MTKRFTRSFTVNNMRCPLPALRLLCPAYGVQDPISLPSQGFFFACPPPVLVKHYRVESGEYLGLGGCPPPYFRQRFGSGPRCLSLDCDLDSIYSDFPDHPRWRGNFPAGLSLPVV